MRLEFIPKHRAKVDAITPLAEKRGQTDTVPAVAVKFTARLPSEKLAMFDKGLPKVLFRAPYKAEIEQESLDPADAQRLTKLTDVAKALGTLNWAGEQSGNKLKLYFGIGNDPHVDLVDVVISKVQLGPETDGVFECTFTAYTATRVDEEVMGRLGLLKAQEVDFELEPPEIVKPTKDLVEQAQTPRQTPAQALAAQLGQPTLQ